MEKNSENLEKFANILWEGKHRKIRSEGPATKKSKLDGSKILSCIKRRVDNSGMSMENEDVEGSDKEADLRQVLDAR